MTSQLPPTTPLPPADTLPPSPPPPIDPPNEPPYGASSWSDGAPGAGRAPLRRSREDRVIGGVCGGLAAHTGIDPLLWRVGAIALTLAGGSGILIYLLLWLLMPAKPGDQGPRTRRRLRIVLVVGAVIALLALVGAGIGAWVTGGDHDRDRQASPRSAEAVQARYSTDLGDIDLDLSRIDVSDLSGPIRTELRSDVGDIDVQVPAGADVQVQVDGNIGDVDLFGQGDSNGFYAGTGSADYTDDGNPEIILVIDSGLGDVQVSRD